MELKIAVIEAKDLRMSDLNGKADPYVTIRVDGAEGEQQTKVIEKSLNPVWNEEFNFEIADLSAANITFTVMDRDEEEDDVVGTGQIQQLDSFKINTEIDQWVDLEFTTKINTLIEAGKLHVKFTIVDPNQNEAENQAAEEAEQQQQVSEPEQVQTETQNAEQNQNQEAEQQKQGEQNEKKANTPESKFKAQAEENEKKHIQYLKERINAHHHRLAALKNHSDNVPSIKTKSAAQVPPSPKKEGEQHHEEEQAQEDNDQDYNEEEIQDEINVIQAKTRKSYNAILSKFTELTSNEQTLDQQIRQRQIDEGEHLEEMSVDKLSSIYNQRKKESKQLDKDIARLTQELKRYQ